MEDEFRLNKKKAIAVFSVISFVLCQPAIFFLGNGVLNELDFWAGTFCLVLFATIETILFAWVFGMDKAWKEMHKGAMIEVPKIYKFIIKYVTPLFLLVILGAWFYQEGIPTILMKNVASANIPYIAATRIMLVLMFLGLAAAVRMAWRRRE